jgi:hypothetical protein
MTFEQVSDVDLESERFRYMGDLRLDVAAVSSIISRKTYNCTIQVEKCTITFYIFLPSHHVTYSPVLACRRVSPRTGFKARASRLRRRRVARRRRGAVVRADKVFAAMVCKVVPQVLYYR